MVKRGRTPEIGSAPLFHISGNCVRPYFRGTYFLGRLLQVAVRVAGEAVAALKRIEVVPGSVVELPGTHLRIHFLRAARRHAGLRFCGRLVHGRLTHGALGHRRSPFLVYADAAAAPARPCGAAVSSSSGTTGTGRPRM